MSEAAGLWQASVATGGKTAQAACDVLEQAGALAVTMFACDRGGWRVTTLFDRKPDSRHLQAVLALPLGGPPADPAITLERVPQRDWIVETVRAFPPRTIGPFFVHGTHAPEPGASGIAIEINAGAAFGSGEHATTEGCLRAIAALEACGFRPTRGLDMGCGSGILAIAAARLWACDMLAVDIDPDAVSFATDAVNANRVADRVAVAQGDGFATEAVRQRVPFDLVLANLLAGPLVTMAGDIAAALRPGGMAGLSGLLEDQATSVHRACADAGLVPERRIDMRGWSTLTVTRGF